MPDMTEAAREARRQYQREWRRTHPELVAAQQLRYWARVAERQSSDGEVKAKDER